MRNKRTRNQLAGITSTAGFQAELNVDATESNAIECTENDVGSRPKRLRKQTISMYEFYFGHHLSSVKPTPKPSSSSDGSTKVLEQFTEQPDCKLAKAKENKQSAAHKMVPSPRMQLPRPKKQLPGPRAVPCTRSMVLDTNNKSDEVVDVLTISDDEQSTEGSRRVKMVDRWHVNTRSMVPYARNENSNDGNDSNSMRAMGANTNQRRKNSLNALCIYCKKKIIGNMVKHYMKNHPDREAAISRLSPQMVEQLKKQEIFQKVDGNKIAGLCYFCDKKKSCSKYGWQKHLTSMHTGEKMFNCRQCHAQMETRNEHDIKICKRSVVNVFECREDGSLVGFMCNDCNYFQFSRDRIVDHLKNEHGFQNPSMPHNFREFVVVRTKNG